MKVVRNLNGAHMSTVAMLRPGGRAEKEHSSRPRLGMMGTRMHAQARSKRSQQKTRERLTHSCTFTLTNTHARTNAQLVVEEDWPILCREWAKAWFEHSEHSDMRVRLR